MSEICQKCGLPKDLCVCTTIAKEEEKIKIYSERKRYRKKMTIIEGISKDVNKKEILTKLKTKFACGGTIKEGNIEIQGDHRRRTKEMMVKMGFPEDMIEISD